MSTTMTMTATRRLSVAEFEQLPDLKGYELIDGEAKEKEVSVASSAIGALLAHLLYAFCLPRRLGTVFGADLLYLLWPDRPNEGRKPDVSFVPADRPLQFAKGYCSTVPYLAVEVVSPTNTADEMSTKVEEYLSAGVDVVWVVYLSTRTVMVYEGTAVQRLAGDAVLRGTGPLTGLEMPLPDIFAVITRLAERPE